MNFSFLSYTQAEMVYLLLSACYLISFFLIYVRDFVKGNCKLIFQRAAAILLAIIMLATGIYSAVQIHAFTKDRGCEPVTATGTITDIHPLHRPLLWRYPLGGSSSHGCVIETGNAAYTAIACGDLKPGDEVRFSYWPNSQAIAEIHRTNDNAITAGGSPCSAVTALVTVAALMLAVCFLTCVAWNSQDMLNRRRGYYG